ncbi:hypothetical protein F5B19DRAFT_489520 [Rostrohypoxylon terebratum]|nr:hypothetical protein F5B19DRAFT_489520 [Rostrohypoxylon terebratum]
MADLPAHTPQPPPKISLPPLRPLQPPRPSPLSQVMPLKHNITPNDFEAATILACIKDEEADRAKAKSALHPSTAQMSGQDASGAGQSGRRTPPSVKRYIASVDQAVGGHPPKGCSNEEWDKYFNKFMIENDRRGVENAEKSWTQLAKTESYIAKMSKLPSQLLQKSSDEEEPPKGSQRSQSDRSGATPKGPVKSTQQPKPAGGHRQHVSNAEKEAAASLTAPATAKPSTQSSAILSQVQPMAKLKRRRTGPESLVSSLGKKWEATVDEEGHRPARRARKK